MSTGLTDKIGRKIKVGDFVVAPFGVRDLRICTVESIGKKMVMVAPIDTEAQVFNLNSHGVKLKATSKKYADDVFILTDKDITRYFISK